MARKWIRARIGSFKSVLVSLSFIGVTLVGLSSIADSRNEVDKEASRFADQFARQLADTLQNDDEFRSALTQSEGCVSEIAALVVAQAALLQAQAEYDIAYQELEECLNSGPGPGPEPGPEPPEIRPANGEVSVLER